MNPDHDPPPLALAEEYLDERDHANRLSADARRLCDRVFAPSRRLGDRLARLLDGRALRMGDRVLVPIRTRRGVVVTLFPLWEDALDGVDAPAFAAELARIAGPDRLPDGSLRTALLSRKAREATGCTVEEAWEIVADMERLGFAGDAEAFAELARSLLERNRAMEAEADDPARSDQFPTLAGPGQVLDPRD